MISDCSEGVSENMQVHAGAVQNTSCQIRSEIIKTDVTAVEIVLDFIFAGIGNILLVFNMKSRNHCISYPILDRHRIHGIRVRQDKAYLVCYGNREIAVASSRFDRVSVTVVNRWIVGDWIWDVKWQSDADLIMILSANNIATLWNWRTKQQLRRVTSGEKCLLYCGVILEDDWNNSVIMGGSMFKCILIWAPSVATDETSSTLHKLTWHKGAIFSVFYHYKLRRICSTSDDRSLRIWQVNFPKHCGSQVNSWAKATIVPTITVYGHMSRVWKSVILDDARSITAGEDSQLRIWDENGSPVCYWETHQEASIRSLSVSENQDLIVTGGKDGGLSIWPLSTNEVLQASQRAEIQFSNTFSIKKVQDVPRHILLSNSGRILTVTNEGVLFAYDGSNWNCVISDARFASYCLFQISKDRQCVCLASICGDVMILKEHDGNPTMEKIYDGVVCSGRIFSFHWLHDYQFITCSTDGCLETWHLNFDDTDGKYHVIKLRHFTLPPCKERWLTSAVQIDGCIIAGDRDGSIHVYRDKIQPSQTFHRIHGRLGVSCISCGSKNQVLSIGRDGYVRYWFVSENQVEHAAADRLPVKWPVRIIRLPSCGLLVLGFNEANFEVWNIEERKKLLTYNCGGGHRPWDFIIDERFKFVYIRGKVICSLVLPLDRLKVSSLVDGFHIRETDCLRYLTDNLIISGGEDTTLRLSYIDEENNFKPAAVIRSHISSIRAISFLRLNDSILVVTAGGRAQLKVWNIDVKQEMLRFQEMASHMLKPTNKCKKPWQHVFYAFELEPRHMDVQIRRQGNEILIYAAGSDAFWRIFTFNLVSKSLQLVNEIEYTGHCILHILRLTWLNMELVVTMGTDGVATFWDANSHMIMHQSSIHQSGINSCDYLALHNDRLVLVTGGDDTAVSLSVFEISNGKIETCGSKSGTLHEAQVSGLRIVQNYLVSAGGDQKVALWKWEVENYGEIQLELLTVHHSFVPDIHGLDLLINSKDEVKVCVYGAGFEVLKLTL